MKHIEHTVSLHIVMIIHIINHYLITNYLLNIESDPRTPSSIGWPAKPEGKHEKTTSQSSSSSTKLESILHLMHGPVNYYMFLKLIVIPTMNRQRSLSVLDPDDHLSPGAEDTPHTASLMCLS